MAALSLRASNALFASAIMLILVVNIHATGDWKEGKATYYGNPDGSGTSEIAEHDGGIVPVKYRRASCKKKGGIRFTIDGNPNFNLVSISNVGGAGDVVGLEVRGGKKLPWTKLRRNWGQKWQTEAKIAKRKLSFRVTTSDGKTLTLYKVTKKNWEYGQTFESKKNF
ncbi:hypothetical protein Leryth_000924 [Lithospermum erythrorhizon]|nr:hypothetical protein Leryth_000924 [Lithospermum erythrorhizon]